MSAATEREQRRNRIDDKVWAAIRAREAAGSGWVQYTIAEDVGIDSTQVSRALVRLVAAGRLRACVAKAPLETVSP